jgi:hypothetical protein
MKTKTLIVTASTLLCLALFVMPALSHHSFAMYDQSKTVVLTGAVKTLVMQANHAELHFYLIQPDRKGIAKTADGKPVEWGVEMAGAAAVAQQGITTTTFGSGTVFSVKLNLWIPCRRHCEMPGGSGDEQGETSRTRQALRFGGGQHTDRWNSVLTSAGSFRYKDYCCPRCPRPPAAGAPAGA